MNPRVRQTLLLVIICSLLGLGVWALFRYQEVRRLQLSEYLANQVNLKIPDADLWARAIEKVKEDRGASTAAIEIPTQLRHYEDRKWFLATQVAEVENFHVQSSQDFVGLAALLERGELVPLPPVTETYILFGVGARADNGPFTRYFEDHNIALYNEPELRDAYAQLDSARLKLETQISNLESQFTALKKAERTKQRDLQKKLAARQQELQAIADEKALLDRAYGQPGSRQTLLKDYESLRALAKNFAGRSFNLDDANDRHLLKLSMLSSLRPQALKILEEVAKAYHDKFARPLPVSSLVRPEQYQHALRRVNRNAVLIDTPPHSTGLAFDIDYRYMSGDEQNFLMTELARMKDEGRIEVIRERGANFHVFAFIDGKRPGDDLINASLASIEEGGALAQDAHHATKEPLKPALESRTVEKKKPTSKVKTNAKSRKRRIH